MLFARHQVFFAQDMHNTKKSRTHIYQLGFTWRNRTGGKDHKRVKLHMHRSKPSSTGGIPASLGKTQTYFKELPSDSAKPTQFIQYNLPYLMSTDQELGKTVHSNTQIRVCPRDYSLTKVTYKNTIMPHLTSLFSSSE